MLGSQPSQACGRVRGPSGETPAELKRTCPPAWVDCEYTRSMELMYRAEAAHRYRMRRTVPRRDPLGRWKLFDEQGRLVPPPPEQLSQREQQLRLAQEERARSLAAYPENVITLRQLQNKYTVQPGPTKQRTIRLQTIGDDDQVHRC